jgi:uncharacterized cupin superfamily protein
VRRVNVANCDLDEREERDGFRLTATSLAPRLGASRIGASVYELDAGETLFPYHYHHGVEEWLYVISGAPTLRDPVGERTLEPGDLVCFPSGHVGAHTERGPGRVMMFSAGGWPDASLCVYPDSDKVGARPGDTGVPWLDVLNFRRSDAVDYWYGEGAEQVLEPVELVRPPESVSRPVINSLLSVAEPHSDDDAPAGFRARKTELGPRLGAMALGATLFELDPAEGTAPYHYECGREEWVLVSSGTPTLRHPDGEDVLEAGDMVCFPEGPAGAHRLINRSGGLARLIMFSTMGLPATAFYPDSGKVFIRTAEQEGWMFRLRDQIGYWDEGSGIGPGADPGGS